MEKMTIEYARYLYGDEYRPGMENINWNKEKLHIPHELLMTEEERAELAAKQEQEKKQALEQQQQQQQS
jgi:hypothetical protein